MKDAPLDRLVRIHKALAHPARLRILAMLRRGQLCACQITAVLRLAPSTVSAHIKELRLAGLIEERKEGRWVRSRLTADPDLVRVLDPLFEALEEDPVVLADAALLDRLLQVDVTVLCRADLDLEALGLLPAVEEEGAGGRGRPRPVGGDRGGP